MKLEQQSMYELDTLDLHNPCGVINRFPQRRDDGSDRIPFDDEPDELTTIAELQAENAALKEELRQLKQDRDKLVGTINKQKKNLEELRENIAMRHRHAQDRKNRSKKTLALRNGAPRAVRHHMPEYEDD